MDLVEVVGRGFPTTPPHLKMRTSQNWLLNAIEEPLELKPSPTISLGTLFAISVII